MAWRFKASKYKNAAPIVPKPEACIRDISVGSYQTYGNNIAASAAFMAFNVDHNGSSLAVLPIDDCGRKSKTMPLLHAHTDTVTDMDFSPFHDGLLATGSQDCLVKIWHIPEKGLEESLSNPECTFSHKQRRVETVSFHPTADGLLSTTSFTSLTLWDLATEQEIFSNIEHGDVIQALSWKRDGSLLVTSCKDKQVRVGDPRQPTLFSHVANSHQSIKDSRVVWLGDSNRILTTGFDSSRQREVYIRDLRNFEEVEKALVLDSSTGVLIPLFDADTSMLFLAGKGDTTILYLEVTDREPFLVEGLRHNGEQTKGACCVPKRALAVMQGEVNRLLQLTSAAVIPITYQVPRKSYRDFHADLFPETAGCEAPHTAAQWLAGQNASVARMSLDPVRRSGGQTTLQVHRGSLSEMRSKMKERGGKGGGWRAGHAAHQNGESSGRRPSAPASVAQHNGAHPTPAAPPKPMPRSMSSRASSLTEVEEPPAPPPRPAARPRPGPGPAPAAVSPTAPAPPPVPALAPAPIPAPAQVPTPANIAVSLAPSSTIATAATTTAAADIPAAPPALTTVTALPPSVVTPVNPNALLSGGYKPRLGPKPFTPPKLNFSSGDGDSHPTAEFSFDKVFHVPAVPGQDTAINGIVGRSVREIPQPPSPVLEVAAPPPTPVPVPAPAPAPAPTLPSPVAPAPTVPSLMATAPIPTVVEELVEEETAPALAPVTPDEKPKTPSTAERRKLFEKRISSAGEPEQVTPVSDGPAVRLERVDDAPEDRPTEFEHNSAQRASFAERRRLYEARGGGSEAGLADKNAGCPPTPSPTPLRRRDSGKGRHIPPAAAQDEPETPPARPEPATTPTPKRTSTVFGRVSKFRHLKGTPLHKSTHIENIRNVSRQITGECDGFHANPERVAVPLGGPGGKIAVFELSRPGKLPDGVIPTLVHGTTIMDFTWDPFDCSRLAVACDDGMIRLWRIPPGGLAEPTNTPDVTLAGHSEKIYFIKFHPLASDILASASYDMTVRIWDLSTQAESITLTGHTDTVFSLAWSPCGAYCATACRDGRLRVYEPRASDQPIREGRGPVGSRGARVVWALEGTFLVVLGFDKVSERQIQVFKADSLNSPLNTVGLDVSPAILIPFYDEDSSTLFLTGRGDSTIYAFEVSAEAPYACPLSHHRCSSLHQGLSFLPKQSCDVANVEFARALRLTNSSIEPLSFTVPRVKTDLFQDDLFPPTKVTWKPTMTSSQWLQGANRIPPRISLQPDGMDSLSAVQGPATGAGGTAPASGAEKPPVNRNLGPALAPRWGNDATKEKQEQIQRAVSSRMEVNMSLEQDHMEGVDEREWED